MHAKRWLRRYGWAELAALVLAVTCATLADTWTNNVLLLAASAYGSISYYGVLLVREMVENRRAVGVTMRTLVVEFGSAEALDSLVFSPVLLGMCVALVPNVALAVVLSESASTAMFYAFVMVGRKRCTAMV